DLFNDDDDVKPYTEIPPILVDISESIFYTYYPVMDKNGNQADLNANNGKRWNALYYTKAEGAGSPITLDESGNCFKVQQNDSAVPAGYVGTNQFNMIMPGNLNANVKEEDAPAVYLYYRTEETVTTKINTGTEAEGQKRYISAIKIVNERSETAAKTKLISEGFEVFDYNLEAHEISDSYVYMGFKTQKNPKNCVRDIRIMPQNSTPVQFGQGKYNLAGLLPSGDGLYYTLVDGMGEPVMPSFQAVKNIQEAKSGYEPISTFSGIPYNFRHGEYNFYSANDNAPWENRGGSNLFLYFLPSVTYTSKNADNTPATEYLAGISILTLQTTQKSRRLVPLAEKILESVNAHVLYQFRNNQNGNDQSWVIYTTTYNPYRAVYGFKSYTAAPKAPRLLPCLSTPSGAYAACDAKFLLEYDTMDDISFGYSAPPKNVTAYLRHSNTHDYLGKQLTTENMSIWGAMVSSNPFFAAGDIDEGMKPEDFEMSGFWDAPYSKATNFVNWNDSELRCKGLYALGCVEGKLPLTVNDIAVSNTPFEKIAEETITTASGNSAQKSDFWSVEDFKTPNATTSHNLAYQGTEFSSDTFYLYFKQAKPKEKKYISSVSVVMYSLEDEFSSSKINREDLEDAQIEDYKNMADDTCISRVLASCQDEILPFDLSKHNGNPYDMMTMFLGMPDTSLNYAFTMLVNGHLWQESSTDYTSTERCAYLGVTRTDDQTSAITGLLKYKPEDGKKPKSSIYVDGANYKRCGDLPIDDGMERYYLYTTTDYTGKYVTGIDFSSCPMVSGAVTAKTAFKESEKPKGNEKTELTNDAQGDPTCTNFIHAYVDNQDVYITDLYIGKGKMANEALCDLITLGCDMMIPYNLNERRIDYEEAIEKYIYSGAITFQTLPNSTIENIKIDYSKIEDDMEFIFIGYKTAAPRKNRYTGAIKDILIITDEEPQATLKYNNCTYIRAKDMYLRNNDFEQAVALNKEDNAYLYYTTGGDGSPFCQIGIAERDRVPESSKGQTPWENILTNDMMRYNLNHDIITFDEDSLLNDNRVYLFGRRIAGSSVKFGAEIVGGHCEELVTYGDLYQQK
ncbi:MAG: hypothetical protein IKP69_02985, partial [Oscillospiraceae bacterium]|nr:hypothetical protein [Oscillospiraceae bacterium]